ncbi:LytTR family DNA-binding domain-containing protein [uncultured Nitratireductor sp.]|uniref:LytR/AlgR family response regulator transcription factor n=1 Tax=uncultured Nitratireductor sp. TaxID=520953 RepID=UPI0025CE5068|nr:LytTR family DNA-binding domain-containing protein [uncultured Nitratireductor sp.]
MSQKASVDIKELETRIARRLLLVCLFFFPLVAAINASSIVSESSRSGMQLDLRIPWALELTSMVAIVLPIMLAVHLERRFPLDEPDRLRSFAALCAGSLAFSLLHIVGMAVLRSVVIPSINGEPYELLAHPVRDFLYEFRKDIFPYAVVIGLLTLYRKLEKSRLAANAEPTEAQETGRLTLKSGGGTIFIDAQTVEWGRAAGNYVELKAAGRLHFPRVTLAALEKQLQALNVDVMRVHKSHIVNRASILEVSPTGEGDLWIKLKDGAEIKGSRRYRAQAGF